MGVLDGLRAWWRGLFGSGGETDEQGDETTMEADTAPESADAADYECAICGTAVEGPDASCPVCRSGDIVAGDRSTENTSKQFHDRQYVEEGDDDSVERLQQVRDSSEILSAHDERWEELDGEFRVETPDGDVTVTSRVEVAALLEEHYD